jgi:gas vesicle protein
MMSEQQQSGGASILIAFLLGAAAGAALALLYAPAAGEDTRRALGRRTREGREKMMEALRQGRGILEEQREHVVTAFERARHQAQGVPERLGGVPQGPREGDQDA